MKTALLVAWITFAAGVYGQTSIPAGTILPLRLSSTLTSRTNRPGQRISARVMQDVPLERQTRIRAGSQVIGHVLEVAGAARGQDASLTLRFDTLRVSKHDISITTNLRALASRLEVQDAQVPKSGPDRGTPEDVWTAVQVGGDVVYRGGGPVSHGLEPVGIPVANGVLVQIAAKPGSNCRGDLLGDHRPQALWVFSSDACGLYGFSDVALVHSGRSDPIGQITLSSKKRVRIDNGSGLLLRVR